MFATHDAPAAASASFSSQRSGYAGSAGHYSPVNGNGAETAAPSAGNQLGNMQEGSSHLLGGVQPSKPLVQDDRPYMNLSEVRQGLSTECNKWGTSVVSELHKAISSTGDGEPYHHCMGWARCLITACNAMQCNAMQCCADALNWMSFKAFLHVFVSDVEPQTVHLRAHVSSLLRVLTSTSKALIVQGFHRALSVW